MSDETPHTEPSSVAPDDVVDLASLRERVADQRDLLRRLLEVFNEQYPTQLAQLRDAAARGDAQDVRRAAHRLVGTMGCFSATRAVSAAQNVERAGDRGDLGAAHRGIDALEREVSLAAPVLARLAAQGFSTPRGEA